MAIKDNLVEIEDVLVKYNAKLLPVVKNREVKEVKEIYDYGYREFAENRLEDYYIHIREIKDAQFHFIAPLQSRKIKEITSNFKWIHSISRYKEIEKIKDNFNNNNLLLQINIDNDFNKFEHNSIEAEFTVNNFVTTFNFLEKTGEMGDVNTIENTTKISFDNQNSLVFKTRRNRKISLTEYYDLVYEYQNDCLTAGIKYRKTYYQDRDLKPKEDLFFTITLFPLTSLDQKVDNSLYSN